MFQHKRLDVGRNKKNSSIIGKHKFTGTPMQELLDLTPLEYILS